MSLFFTELTLTMVDIPGPGKAFHFVLRHSMTEGVLGRGHLGGRGGAEPLALPMLKDLAPQWPLRHTLIFLMFLEADISLTGIISWGGTVDTVLWALAQHQPIQGS